MEKTKLPSPQEIVEQHKEQLLTQCIEALDSFTGNPVRVYVDNVEDEVVDFVTEKLIESHWHPRVRKVWEFDIMFIPSRHKVIDIWGVAWPRPPKQEKSFSLNDIG